MTLQREKRRQCGDAIIETINGMYGPGLEALWVTGEKFANGRRADNWSLIVRVRIPSLVREYRPVPTLRLRINPSSITVQDFTNAFPGAHLPRDSGAAIAHVVEWAAKVSGT